MRLGSRYRSLQLALCHIATRVRKNSAANPVCPTEEFPSACFLGELRVAALLYALDPVFAEFQEVGAVSWLYWLLLLLQRLACCCSTVSSKQELAALHCRVPPALPLALCVICLTLQTRMVLSKAPAVPQAPEDAGPNMLSRNNSTVGLLC